MESPYLRGFAICDFDIDVGQTTRLCEPADCVSADEAHKIACLSLPDSNTSVFRDVVYTFRMRSDVIPLFASTTLDHSFTFGCSFFRQQRDARSRRGFVQQAVVVLSRTPFVGLLKHIARVVGSHYLDADEGVRTGSVDNPELPRMILQAACEEISRWPPPVPGTLVELPLLGCLLSLRVPWSSMLAHAPATRESRHTARPVIASPTAPRVEAVEEARSLHATLSAASNASGGSPLPQRHERALSAPVASASSGGSSSLRRYSNTSSGSDEAPVQRTEAPASFADVFAAKTQELPGMFQELGLFGVFRGLSPCLWHLWQLALTGQPILVMASSPEACGDAVLAIVSLISPIHYCADFRPYFTLYDPDFASITKLANSVWGTHTRSPKLPHHAASPSAATVPLASAATLTSASMPAVSATASSSPAASSPPLIIGTTNPFFTKALERWPNALWLGGTHGTSTAPPAVTPVRRTAAAVSGATHVASAGTLLSSTSSAAAGGGSSSARTPTKGVSPRVPLPSFSTPRGYTASDAKPKVIAASASLTDALPAPGQEMMTEARFVVRQPAAIQPDAHVLSSLLRLRAGDEDGVQLRLGGVTPLRTGRGGAVAAAASDVGASEVIRPHSPLGFGPGISFIDEGAAGGGQIPAIIINNAILRQHFRQLTLAFLRPFERYFRAREHVKGAAAGATGLLGRGQPIPSAAAAHEPQPAGMTVRGYRAAGRVAPGAAQAAAPAVAEDSIATVGAGFGPYDDLTTLLLPRFDEASFMAKLEADGGPRHRLLQSSDWRTLYRGFMAAPHFHPWFNARRREACRELHKIARTVRLQTTRDALLGGLGLARGVYDGMTWTNPAAEHNSPSHDSVGSGGGPVGGASPDAGPRLLLAPAAASSSSFSPPPSASSSVSMRPFSMLPPTHAADGASRRASSGPLPRIVGRGSPHAIAIAQGLARGLPTTSGSPGPSPVLRGAPGSASPTPEDMSVRDVGLPGATGGPPHTVILLPAPAATAAAASASVSSAGTSPPPRRITGQQMAAHEEAAVTLHNKITACFVREEAFLVQDDELLRVMRAHLTAVEAVMPPRVLTALRAAYAPTLMMNPQAGPAV